MTLLTTRHRILITGSRSWNDPGTIESAISLYMVVHGNIPYTVIHGGANGADMMADYAAEVLRAAGWDVAVEEHLADWDAHGRAAGVLRNQAMVDMGADIVLAFIRNASPGATHCLKSARDAGLDTQVYTK